MIPQHFCCKTSFSTSLQLYFPARQMVYFNLVDTQQLQHQQEDKNGNTETSYRASNFQVGYDI